jgi:hypothetical protein
MEIRALMHKGTTRGRVDLAGSQEIGIPGFPFADWNSWADCCRESSGTFQTDVSAQETACVLRYGLRPAGQSYDPPGWAEKIVYKNSHIEFIATF